MGKDSVIKRVRCKICYKQYVQYIYADNSSERKEYDDVCPYCNKLNTTIKGYFVVNSKIGS